MIKLQPSERIGTARCPFCHEDVPRHTTCAACSRCRAPHHVECFSEGSGCAACRETDRLAEEPVARVGKRSWWRRVPRAVIGREITRSRLPRFLAALAIVVMASGLVAARVSSGAEAFESAPIDSWREAREARREARALVERCDYAMAIRRDPGYAEAYIERAAAAINRNEFEQAMPDCDAAVALEPLTDTPFLLRAWAREHLGDLDGAIADCGELIVLTGRAQVFVRRGRLWSRKGDLDRAIADFGAAVEADPHFSRAFVERGSAWEAKGDLDRAVADYTKAIVADPGDAEPYLARARIHEKQAHWYSASDDYERAAGLEARNRVAWIGSARANRHIADDCRGSDMAESLHRCWRYEMAAAQYEHALVLDSRDAGTVAEFASLLDKFDARAREERDSWEMGKAMVCYQKFLGLDLKGAFADTVARAREGLASARAWSPNRDRSRGVPDVERRR